MLSDTPSMATGRGSICAKSLKAMAVLNIGAGWAKVLRHSAFEAWAVRKSLEILSEKRNTHPQHTREVGAREPVAAQPHSCEQELWASRSFCNVVIASLAAHCTCRSSKMVKHFHRSAGHFDMPGATSRCPLPPPPLLSNGRLVCACAMHIVYFINRS